MSVIDKQAEIEALGEKPLASAEAENIEEFKKNLSRTINAGIVATDAKDIYSCGMRNGMRWCRSLLEDDPPKFEDASVYVQPTVDTIPVVRCRDCKHRFLEDKVWACPFGLPGGPEFFCSYGMDGKDGDQA